MKRILALILMTVCLTLQAQPPRPQGQSGQPRPSYAVKGRLVDSQSGEPLPYATVSLTRPQAEKPSAYALTDDKGFLSVQDVRAGRYVFKAELLGYKPFSQDIELKADLDLGTIRVEPDLEQLEAAKVSAAGNSIIVKKDTIEYNATSFKTTDNDVLEDLLKKLPGVEVSEDGSITVNGQSIKKITIDGKTFFLDDPQLASKNIPAKIVDKVKVVEKKSDQAQFTGIDDGEEETVIDLSIRPGMMKGTFGNVMGGVGYDVPVEDGDLRFQAAAFAGKFTDSQQLSFIGNANNTNNRGFNDLSGSMMSGMRGGDGGMGRGQGGWGGRNGITTSYMGGFNGAWTLCDGDMDLGGNYLYGNTDKDVRESSDKITYLDGPSDLKYTTSGVSNTRTDGHRFGVRLDHKFSEQTSILFEPRINFGSGSFSETDTTVTYNLTDDTDTVRTNDSRSLSTGANKNVTASGFVLFRQRLGAPGRTMTVMARYELSNNVLEGNNISGTRTYDAAGNPSASDVNQRYDQDKKGATLWGNATFTQPIWKEKLFAEANYSYSWNRATSTKTTYDWADGSYSSVNADYSNSIVNEYVNQEIGVNLLYQTKSFRAQAGFAAKPTRTRNRTSNGSSYQVDTTRNTVNWAPQGMLWWEMNDNASARVFYRGSSQQPSTSQLISVPDNTNPLAVSFGNPTLAPYFSHTLRGDIRYNNKKSFASLNVRFDATYNENPIVNATWYTDGISYTMPVNGNPGGSANVSLFVNLPIGKSNFSVLNMTRFGYSHSSNYVLTGINTPDYVTGGALSYDKFFGDYGSFDVTENITNSLSLMERLRVTYRIDALEIQAGARTRINDSRYTIASTEDRTTTFSNRATASLNWTWDIAGLTVKSDFNFDWYEGYSTKQDNQYVFNAEIQKTLLRRKATLALKAYDILDSEKNLTVTDTAGYHKEALNNTLGRYVILSFTYRFGNFDRSKMRGPGGPPRMR